MHGSREIILDVPRIALDGDGVKDFFWPLSWKQHHAVRDAFLAGLGGFVRSGIENGDRDAELLAILFMEYAQEALRGWYAIAVTRRFAEAGCSLVVDPQSGLSKGAAGHWTNPRNRLALLRQRFPTSWWRTAFRPLYGVIRNDGFSWRYPAFIDFEHALVATDPCALARARATASDEPVFLVSMRYWLGELCSSLPADISHLAARPATIDSAIEITRRAAGASGDALPDSLVRHLREWLITASGTVRFYLDGLCRTPERLPKRLWTGSGGYVFRRILHVAVRRTGGHSVSHDHGSGLGYFSIIDTNLTEFVSPDVFVTFNPAQAEGYRKQRREAYRICRRWPEIASAPAPKSEPAPRRPPRKRKIETVMFVASPYRGEQMVFTPIEFDLVAVDWQARLFRWLLDEGYTVINKAHPDSMAAPPAAFAETLGVPAVPEPLEQVMDRADLYILDYLHSSALGTILNSGKPILYIDFGHCPLWPEAEQLFSRRVRIVHGWPDDANRLQVDWQELHEAIGDSRQMTEDTSFADTYLPQL